MQFKSIGNKQSIRAAFYARVSSDQQAQDGTIESQVAALEERAAADQVKIHAEMRFIDDGESGATLVRPELERLRDLVSSDGIDRLYVLCPDRLSRKHSHQILLIDELEHYGVELIFLDHESRNTPEDRLLVQVQGVVAEYEREKIVERCRRGKLHLARRGTVSVLSAAPYGYRYVPAAAGVAPAQYNIQLEQAAVVRDLFQWIGIERLSIYGACKRLENRGILSPRGRKTWDRSTVWSMLKNPAYKGKAAFGKTRLGPMRPRLRGARGCSDLPRGGQSCYATPEQQWITIAVPPIVEEELFNAVGEQLKENQKRCRQRHTARHLLQGLVVCECCRYGFYGRACSGSKPYVYYRCSGTDPGRFGGHRVCDNKPVSRDALDRAVWDDVRSLLANPKRVEEELNRRMNRDDDPEKNYGKKLKSQIDKVNRGISRLVDAYAEGVLDRSDFEPRIKSAKARLSQLQVELQSHADLAARARELRGIVDHLQTFSRQVMSGLDHADWETKRKMIQTLIKKIEIGKESINVIYRVDLFSSDPSPSRGICHYCRTSGRSFPA